MPLVDLKTDLKSLKYGKDRPGGGSSKQPFIQTKAKNSFDLPIEKLGNEVAGVPAGPDFILRGGLLAPVRAATDASRLFQLFTQTPSGLQFTAKQNILSRTSVETESSTSPGYGFKAVNQGIYTPLSTLGQTTVGFSGTHLNLLGLDPTSPMTGVVDGGLFPGAGLNRYDDVVKNKDKEDNRLVKLTDKKINAETSDPNILSYSGGPGSVLGIGKTNIKFTDQRTGINNKYAVGDKQGYFYGYSGSMKTQGANYLDQITSGGATKDYIKRKGGEEDPNLKKYLVNDEGQILRGGQKATGEKNDLASSNPGYFYGYSGSMKTQGANYLDQIISGGATADYIKREGEYTPNLLDGLINEEGQIIRGGQDKTGKFNDLANSPNPGYFYGKTGKEQYTPDNYLKSLSLETNGDKNTLNRVWNSVSKEFVTWTDEIPINFINPEGKQTYNPSVVTKVTKDGGSADTNTTRTTNTTVTTKDGAASLTQEQILSQILSRQSGTQVRDFRREITADSIGTEAYKKARNNGTLTDAPAYSGPNAKNYEQRVNAGDPGKRGLIRTNYSKGAIDPATNKPYVVNEINAMYMYVADSVTENKKKNDFVKLRFAVINPDQPSQKTFVHFPAFFDGAITDNMSANWDSFKYLGRAEEFHNYTGFNREIGFSFTVAAQSKPELSIMYQKLNYLQSSLTPNYNITDGFMRGNIHQLTLGGYFYEQPGILTSLNYTMPQDSPWEIGIPADSADREDVGGISYRDPSVKELTHMIQVQVSFKPIHTFLPQIVGSSLDRFNNLDGIFGKGNIDQRYIALTNDGDKGSSNDLYSKGTPNRTYLPEYSNKLGLGSLEPSSDTE